MAMRQVAIPQQSLNEFCQRYRVKSLALFGSVLREDFRPDSDIDVLVTFFPDAQVSFLTLGKMTRELSAIFNKPVDLVLRNGLKPLIRDAVLSSAQVIYAA